MNLSYKELKKREVVNVADGTSFGNIIDLTLSFPQGNLISITVPGQKGGILHNLFRRGKIVIEETNIIKIGGDVILVNLKCGESCAESISLNRPSPPPCPPKPPCPPNPPSRPPSPPIQPRKGDNYGEPFGGRIDLDDY